MVSAGLAAGRGDGGGGGERRPVRVFQTSIDCDQDLKQDGML
jgi:hypothetical protein